MTRVGQSIEWFDFDTCADAWIKLGEVVIELGNAMKANTATDEPWPLTHVIMDYGYDSGMPTRYAYVTIA